MKRVLVCLIALLAMGTSAVKAEGVEFAYEAGAELVSSYIWRGQYNGGLSFQPTATVGFESEHVNFQGGIWASVGASDWGFRKGLEQEEDYNPNTKFVPEIDFTFMFDIHGLTLGLTHYYYCDGGNFFGWKSAQKWQEAAEEYGYKSTSTTELTLGYNFSSLMPEGHNLYFNWNTMVAGADFKETAEGDMKHNYSSYLEIGYDYTFEEQGVTLGGQLGIVPWKSAYYGNEKGTVTNIALRLGKTWEFGEVCSLELFGQGSINPYLMKTGFPEEGISGKETVFVKASGDDKIGYQSLNGTIGLGVWF